VGTIADLVSFRQLYPTFIARSSRPLDPSHSSYRAVYILSPLLRFVSDWNHCVCSVSPASAPIRTSIRQTAKQQGATVPCRSSPKTPSTFSVVSFVSTMCSPQFPPPAVPQIRTGHSPCLAQTRPDQHLHIDGDSSSPAPAKATPAPAAAGAKATPAPRAVPGAAGANANKDAGAARGARGGRYPSRGGPRTREDRGPRNTLDAATGEGQETAGGFDGERVGELLFGLRTKGRLAGKG